MRRSLLLVAASVALVGLWLASGPAGAHFSTGTKVRTIVVGSVEATGEGLVVYVRAPLPLVFTDVVRVAQDAGTPVVSPFLRNETTEEGTVVRLALQAVAADEAGFRARLAGALAFRQSGKRLAAGVTDWRVLDQEPRAGFASVAEARDSLIGTSAVKDPVFGDAYVDYALRLDAPVPLGPLTVAAGYPAMDLPPGVSIDNHIVDERGDDIVGYRRASQLETPAPIDGSEARVIAEFAWQGVVHILDGLDHVLLVVCLALGAVGRSGLVVQATVARLAWLVTAFTVGHSVTLVASVLGATPSWPWFVPAVEAAIAATVLLAAVSALAGWTTRPGSVTGTTAAVAAIGLLHGLGFSFVLGEILGRDAPYLISALAAFNIGIEAGQLVILVVTLAACWVAARVSASQGRHLVPTLRIIVLAAILATSAWWVVERLLSVI